MKQLIALLTILPLLAFAALAHGEDLLETDTTYTTVDVEITTTTETVIATSTAMIIPDNVSKVCVTCSGIMTTSADSSAYQVALVKGSAATGTDIGTPIPVGVKVTAGGLEEFYRKACVALTAKGTVQYSCTIDMTGATGTTTVGESMLTVDLIQ